MTASPRPLKNLTRADLEPIWNRTDIPTERIARALGVTRQGLSHKARALGLPSRAKNRMKYVDDDTFARMWSAGVSTTDMARYFGYCGAAAISHRRALLGLPPRKRGANRNSSCGWVGTISLREFFELDLARKMRESAEATKVAARAAERAAA